MSNLCLNRPQKLQEIILRPRFGHIPESDIQFSRKDLRVQIKRQKKHKNRNRNRASTSAVVSLSVLRSVHLFSTLGTSNLFVLLRTTCHP